MPGKKTNTKIKTKSQKKKTDLAKPLPKGKKKVETKEVERKRERSDKSVMREGKEKEIVFARARYIAMSARKVRLVVDIVRGKNAIESVAMLRFVRKKAALPIRKTIESAIANADHNFEMDRKKLMIKKAFIDVAPTFKRGRAGSRGRYKKILKRNCHITIGVAEV